MKNLLLAIVLLLTSGCIHVVVEESALNRSSNVRHLSAPGAGIEGLPFSPAVQADDIVFLSGQIGNVPGTKELVPGGVAAETRQAMENIRSILAFNRLRMDDIAKCTVFLASIDDYAAMNEVYASYFPENPPARSTVAASGLALGALVEIECIASADDDED